MAGFEKEFANDGHQQQLAKHAKEAIPELFAAHAEDNPDHPGERRGNLHSPRLCDALPTTRASACSQSEARSSPSNCSAASTPRCSIGTLTRTTMAGSRLTKRRRRSSFSQNRAHLKRPSPFPRRVALM